MDSNISSENDQSRFAQAKADILFSHYSESAASILTKSQTDTLVNGGVGVALADASATFKNDAAFSDLFTDTTGISSGGNNQVKSNSETLVAASFSIAAHQTFSFDFLGELALTVKEIENSQNGSNEAKSKTAFLVLDTTEVNKPKVLDYFGISGDLSSPSKIDNLKISTSYHVKIKDEDKKPNDGSNDTESLTSNVSGSYKRRFNHATNITVVEVNNSSVALEDTLTSTQDHKDALTGGADHGKFVVNKDDLQPGKYDLKNFEVGKDEVDFHGWGNVDASTWFNGIVSGHQLVDTQKGALLTLSPGEDLLFVGVHAIELSPSNFHFL